MEDNIKLGFITDGASEYQLEYNPIVDIWFEHLQESHILADGRTKLYHKGYKFWSKLSWQSPLFFRGEQYDRLRQIFNLHEGMTIYPAPLSVPGACYAVQWINDFDFHLVAGVTPFGYDGMIVLEGTDVLSEIDDNIVMGNG
jgi:hypothetical protein